MGNINFQKYIKQFERDVILEGINQGILGKLLAVNVREGKFACTAFARFIGQEIDSDDPFVIDYYGHYKRSKGFREEAAKKITQIKDRQVKSIQTTVVFFAALKIEDIEAITTSHYLKGGFAEFKNIIRGKRGFGKEEDRPNTVIDIEEGRARSLRTG